MPPTLYAEYTRDEALATFGSSDADWYCDRQFAVLPGEVLCFVTVGDPARESYFSSPSRLVWRPARPDYNPGGEATWLPTPVREVWSADRKRQVRQHHVFARQVEADRFNYLGTAHLGSYGNSGRGFEAGFSLNEKLPRNPWLRVGGYPGWLVEVNHDEQHLNIDDVTGLERLLARLSQRKFSHLALTRYEEDSLHLHTNPHRGWLMYLRFPADNGLYTRDTAYSGEPGREEFFECACGIDLEFPADQTLSRDRAVDIVREYFVTGRLPESVPWANE